MTVPAIRGLTVCVGPAYAKLLAVTLWRNMRHLTDAVVVTTPDDAATHEVVRSVPGARVFATDAFYRHGAAFNKGLACEEAFDDMGRSGWIAIIDADTMLPDSLPLHLLRPDCLHGCPRRILADPSRWHPGFDWRGAQETRDGACVGYLQIFRADAPTVRERRPWYDVSFAHAGGGDAYFLELWPKRQRIVLPMEVLHLGPRDTHWFGTTPEAKDLMTAYVVRNGWTRFRPDADPTAVHRVGEIVERVQVPGYEPSSYQLPFVRRRIERERGRG